MRGAARLSGWLLIAAAGACGGSQGGAPERPRAEASDAGRSGPATAARSGSPDEGPPIELAASAEDRGGRPSKDLLTREYLTGGWCFAPEDGLGEGGIHLFDADGSYHVGLGWVWTDTERRFEAPWSQTLSAEGDLHDFRQRFTELVEIEPDRFVVSWPNKHKTVFERGPCGDGEDA